MQTLLLDQDNWDLLVDARGNIAVASNPYSLAQDASSEIRLFLGEQWYDTTRGVPYWQQILGKWPPLSYMKNQFVTAALLTPETTNARCFIISVDNREVRGQVQILDKNSSPVAVSFFGRNGL